MISHLILMKLKDPADTEFVASTVLSMRGRIPGLQSAEGGPSVVQLATTWDLGFMMRFDDAEAVVAYQSHPVHLGVASQIRDRILEMASCDLAETTPS